MKKKNGFNCWLKVTKKLYDNLLYGNYGCKYEPNEIFAMFENLVGAVIFGVDEQLWLSIKDKVCNIIHQLPDKKYPFLWLRDFVKSSPILVLK